MGIKIKKGITLVTIMAVVMGLTACSGQTDSSVDTDSRVESVDNGQNDKKVKGTIVECNTAYGGSRSETEMHYQVAKDHGFTDIADYDSFLVISHFKGHAMAGFGGAIKNISIGIDSSEGKSWIHTGGTSKSGFYGDQDDFLESNDPVALDQACVDF